MAYGRLGVVRTRFDSTNQTLTAAKLVLVCKQVSCKIGIYAEYDYTKYGNLYVTGSPRSDAFNLGLVYKIN